MSAIAKAALPMKSDLNPVEHVKNQAAFHRETIDNPVPSDRNRARGMLVGRSSREVAAAQDKRGITGVLGG